MCELRGHIEAAEPNETFRTTDAARPAAWSMPATARPHKVSNFGAMPLAVAGHDLRQPLQVIRTQRLRSINLNSLPGGNHARQSRFTVQ
jgi:two-component system, OmpR family, phosphate regulon sensor histidine kinase PhoR